MTTTPELLDAMIQADLKRASMGTSSMHPSWLDGKESERLMRDLERRMFLKWPKEFLQAYCQPDDES